LTSLEGERLTVFTAHPEAIDRAAFVAISPHHPEIERWNSAARSNEQTGPSPEASAGGNAEGEDVLLETDLVVTGAGTESPLPVVVSSIVDARFGPTAVLGIPAVDEVDAELAKRMRPPSGMSWRIKDKGPSSPRSTRRYGERDLPISQRRAWGTPIPVVDCKACGAVAVAVADLPMWMPQGPEVTDGTGDAGQAPTDVLACPCPRCGAPARRQLETLSPRFDGLWQWMAPCLATGATDADAPTTSPLENRELERWLPAALLICDADAGEAVFDRRALAKTLRDLGPLSCLPDGEPFAGVTMHGPMSVPDSQQPLDLDALIEEVGADAVRLAILYGAAPANALTWTDHSLRFCHRWLCRLWEFAQERLSALADDTEAGERHAGGEDAEGAIVARGRLTKWSGIATLRITENLEGSRMHRAVANAITFLTRIEEFERQAIEGREELGPRDARASAEALLVLVRLLAPLAPHIAQELWSVAGRESAVQSAPWPRPRSKSQSTAERGAM